MYPAPLFDKADELLKRGVFLGGVSRETFVTAGRGQLEILLSRGLLPHHRVLDVGCGALRGGWWLINFLRPGCYYGIEPVADMLNNGVEIMLGKELAEEKRPTFDRNEIFDFSVFGQQFDFVIARSIWTHASRKQIRTMLHEFLLYSTPEAEFVASICPPRFWQGEYNGHTWHGRDLERRDKGGIAPYRFRTVRKMAAEFGLSAAKLGRQNGQTWVVVTR